MSKSSPDLLLQTEFSGLPVQRGKVRDIYDLGSHLLLISTDRISAFDWILPTGIPNKGQVLTQLSRFWFNQIGLSNHFLTADVAKMELPAEIDPSLIAGRAMLVRKANVVPIECVVRGYLSGSGWKEYQEKGEVCGVRLPTGLTESEQLPEPIFTPATKAELGDHDINISFTEMCDRIGNALAELLRERSIQIYEQGAAAAAAKGIVIADTKFEFGLVGDEPILIDEVLTPDSSRFWPQETYAPGKSQQSFDKQFVRDWLSQSDWDRESPPPELPPEIVAKTRQKYLQAYELITGSPLEYLDGTVAPQQSLN